ncbi:MAG: orotate phosphoribosyltransferase [Gammaproteobacteria bacterium]
MNIYQKEFIKFTLSRNALKFGKFHLKSGRISPYFFNAGMFNDGESCYKIGMFYSDAINENFNGEYDVIFGPAYKGIPLSTAASIGLKVKYNQTLPISFNRKEVKDHGEGGLIIGTALEGKRVLLIDDVITAGTTIRDSLKIINDSKGKLVGIVIALNRQEKGLKSELSTIQEVQQEFGIKVVSVITLDNLIEFLQEENTIPDASDHLANILAYKALYGCAQSEKES